MAGCPNPSRVGLAIPPTRFNRRAVRSIQRVIYEMIINFLDKRSPLLAWRGLYVIWGMWLPSRLPLEGSNHFRVYEL
jgi:hypothetical protein